MLTSYETSLFALFDVFGGSDAWPKLDFLEELLLVFRQFGTSDAREELLIDIRSFLARASHILDKYLDVFPLWGPFAPSLVLFLKIDEEGSQVRELLPELWLLGLTPDV